LLIAILALYSSSNTGDVGHASALLSAISDKMAITQPVKVDALKVNDSTELDQIVADYNAKITIFKDSEHIILAIGEKAATLLHHLIKIGSLEKSTKNYIFLGIHQYMSVVGELSSHIDHLAIPEAAITEDKIKSLDPNTKLSLTFAVPTSKLSLEFLQELYDQWQVDSIQKLSLSESHIIVTLPGDAPNEAGKINCFTKESAKKLFDHILQLYHSKGGIHRIIIQNSSRQ
jgi:hypothetical protein